MEFLDLNLKTIDSVTRIFIEPVQEMYWKVHELSMFIDKLCILMILIVLLLLQMFVLLCEDFMLSISDKIQTDVYKVKVPR